MPCFNAEYMEKMTVRLMKKGMELVLAIVILVSLLNYFETDEKIPIKRFIFTEEMSDHERENFLNRRDITILNSKKFIKSIGCFDVNERGMVAIGLESLGTRAEVAVYDCDGNYKYGYSFDTHGSFYVEWENDNLWIYFVRSDSGVLLDSKANCIKCVNIYDVYSGMSHWEELSYGKRRTGDDVYQFTRGKIIKSDKEGHKKVIYDASVCFGASLPISRWSTGKLVEFVNRLG